MNIGSAAAQVARKPFPFVELPEFLNPKDADRLLDWLEATSVWQFRAESFYEQYEFNLLSSPPSGSLSFLVGPHFVGAMTNMLRRYFDVEAPLEIVSISAHKLTIGQTIRVHNDHLGPEETHRVLIQLNRDWSMADGGLLMLFGSDRAEDVRFVIRPRHGSAFAFEISHRSYHAVSTIRCGTRFTLVYTFCADH